METPREQPFGKMPDQTQITSYTLTNSRGMQVSIINYGATVTSLVVPLSNGKKIDVVLGFDKLESYIKSIDLPAPPYFGATIGRWAGRINKGVFSLNDKQYKLKPNNGGHLLHGGAKGFSQVPWTLKSVDYDEPSITFTYFSPDGDQGFPGDLTVDVTYALTNNNELRISYMALASDDTIINLTHHGYFNLDGHDSSLDGQKMYINAMELLETRDMIPTGEFINVAESPFDFTIEQSCPEKIDTSFVLQSTSAVAATLFNPKNNLKMSVVTDQPSVHIYVGGDLFKKLTGKHGARYHPYSGICFETQIYPDSPNHPHFPNAILRKGETYRQETTYQFEQ